MAATTNALVRRAALPPVIATLDDRLSDDEVLDTLHLTARAQARNTQLAYAADWEGFARWAASRGAEPIPCPPGLLCGYLSALFRAGRKASTISRHAAAIAHFHRERGIEPPTNSEAVKRLLRGIRREIGTDPAKKAPATADIVRALMDACPASLIGLRDRALFAIGLAGAFRRSELIALRVEDLTAVPEGLHIRIKRSKTDQEGKGQLVAIPHGARIRPVETLRAWLEAACITEGPLFRPVRLGGRVGAEGMSHHALIRALKKRAKAAGLDPKLCAGHSLRSGFMTSASATGATLPKMMEQSRHRSADSALGYVRDRDRFRDHAGAGFL